MQLNVTKWVVPLLLFCAIFAMPALAAGGIEGTKIAVWMAIPFAGILLSIAIFPLVAGHFWHHHFGKVALFWGIVGAGLLFANFAFGEVVYEIVHIVALDYVPFIILLLGLFTIAGGVRIKGTMRGSPKLNCIMLIIGTVLASMMGTTGAAMLMIRPLLKANEWRKRKTHIVVFFIFLVCNIGGSLTPLGDPPLFLGFLKGVSFEWTLNMAAPMFMLMVILVAIFYVFDSIMLKKEEHQTPPAAEGDDANEKFGIEGGINFALLACLIGAILLGSTLANGALKDKDAAAAYDQQIALSTERAENLHHALLWVASNAEKEADRKYGPEQSASAPDPMQAVAHYEKAIALSEEIEAEEHKAHAAEPHASRGDQSIEILASKAEAKTGEHAADDHGHADPFIISKEYAEAMIADKRAAKVEFAGGLDARLKAFQAGAKADEIKAMVLLDFQHAVMATNTVRGHQSHDSTMGLVVAGVIIPWANLIRDGLILLLALISWKVTSLASRKKNGFTWFPIVEVGKLFAAIFICIIPALKILQAGVDGELASVVNMVTDETGRAINDMYFWLTGILSSFLDNAPTYLVFFNTAGGDAQFLMSKADGGGFHTLLAISMGAVFMGANTYIGNAPNFMVKAIAEESDIKMPSFFGYMIWSMAILAPLFVVVDLLVIHFNLFDGLMPF